MKNINILFLLGFISSLSAVDLSQYDNSGVDKEKRNILHIMAYWCDKSNDHEYELMLKSAIKSFQDDKNNFASLAYSRDKNGETPRMLAIKKSECKRCVFLANEFSKLQKMEFNDVFIHNIFYVFEHFDKIS